jgi:hypothetical protein
MSITASGPCSQSAADRSGSGARPTANPASFYREWSGDKDWVRIKATAEECPRIPAEERETLSEDMYRQAYGCEFKTDEGSLFDEAEITARLSARVKRLW